MTVLETAEREPEAGAPYSIELRGIVKRFPGVVANDGVDLKVRRGTIHAIVGENGAGKSTLMKTLYGTHQPDEGTILVDGEEQHFRSPGAAIRHGIGMVFQHFMLADNFTVWENIVLGSEPGWPVLAANSARRKIRALSSRYGLNVDPDELVSDLGVGEKQRVEILKVLYRGAEILILDEPTAVLVPHEVDELFASLRQLTGSKATVIFISHKLDEVLAYADAITVIRAGRTVGEIDDPSSVTAEQLAEMMVGSELPSPETRESTVTERVLLDVVDLAVEPAAHAGDVTLGITTSADLFTGAPGPVAAHRPLDGVSFQVHAGEIVGIAGVEGNGQAELVDAIVGLVPATGSVGFDDVDISNQSTLARRAAGIGLIPEDRQRDGMVLGMTLWENVLLGHQASSEFTAHGLIDREACRRRAEEVVRGFDVRTPTIDVRCFTLSGGNQQKLIVGREMLAEPRVLIAAHPTRGVDVGAQTVIWDILRDARAAGLATLLISADLEELIGLSDRLLVMLRGRIVAELDPATVSQGDLGGYMTGALRQEPPGEPSVEGDGHGA
jgi:general nucleoside transport system ATP-binding protein